MEDNSDVKGKVLKDQLQEASTSEGKSLFAVDFSGKANIKDEKTHEDELLSEFIPELNKQTERIIEEIQKEIHNNLPPGLGVKLNISFSNGSIAWQGIADVLDVLGKIVDGVDFTKLVISVIRFSINKILRREIETKYAVTSIDTDVHKRKIKDSEHLITRILWWCSGITKDILKDTPTEKAKYVGIGGVVLTTGALACLSGGYAIYTVFEASRNAVLAGLIFGPIWGLIIFNLDRYIVASMKKEKNPSRTKAILKEFGPAMPRFIVAILLGITISIPLELRIFQPEIQSKIEFNKDNQMRKKREELDKRYTIETNELNNRLQQIDEQIAGKEQMVNMLRESFYQEMDSRGGTRVYGYGPVAQKKETEFKKVDEERKKEIDSLREKRNAIEKELSEFNALKKTGLEDYEKTLGKGILSRIEALSDLSKEYNAVFLTSLVVFLLFSFFEIAPVLVKLLARFGPYDANLGLREEADIERAEFKKKSVVSIAENHYEHRTRAEKQIEESFFDTSVGTRQAEINLEFQRWRRARSRGQPQSFQEFLDSVEDSLYLERN